VTDYFDKRMPKFKIEALGFREKLWLYKSHLWYSFLIQDFKSCYKYSRKWVDLFYDNETMIPLNPVFFLRGYQYLLEALFFIKHHQKFKNVLNDFEQITQKAWFPHDDNIDGLVFLYLYSNKINLHFMEGSFNEGLPLIEEVLEGLKRHANQIDEHHVMVFYYKIASLYFGTGDYEKAICFLSKIINNKSLQMREDLLCFSRILNLVAHYEAGLDYQLDRLIKNTYKFLIKMEDLYAVQKEMVSFLKSLGGIYPNELKAAFGGLQQKLLTYEDHPYERRAFLYLDIISWLESKIENKSTADIIKEKFTKVNVNI
jgi:tetratricopeptide (TPR) repeat protein